MLAKEKQEQFLKAKKAIISFKNSTNFGHIVYMKK